MTSFQQQEFKIVHTSTESLSHFLIAIWLGLGILNFAFKIPNLLEKFIETIWSILITMGITGLLLGIPLMLIRFFDSNILYIKRGFLTDSGLVKRIHIKVEHIVIEKIEFLNFNDTGTRLRFFGGIPSDVLVLWR